MALIIWGSKYSVNIVEIDSQHKKLVEMVNNLHDRMKEGKAKDYLSTLLQELASYTVSHFKTEEDLFAKHGYPDSRTHIRHHQDLVAQVVALQNDLKSGKSILTLDVMNFLSGWLTKHIMASDKAYSAFLNSKGVK